MFGYCRDDLEVEGERRDAPRRVVECSPYICLNVIRERLCNIFFGKVITHKDKCSVEQKREVADKYGCQGDPEEHTCCPILVVPVHVLPARGALGDLAQVHHNTCVGLLQRKLLGRLSVLGLDKRVGPCAHKCLDTVGVPAPCSPVQRCLAVCVQSVHIGTTLD